MSITASGAEVTVIINNLKDLVINNLKDIGAFRDQLASSLESFEVVIEQQAEWRNNQPDLELMVRETMKLAREAEDAIGTFLVDEWSQRAKGSFSKLFRKFGHKRRLHILVEKIGEIREKVNQILQQYKMDSVERPKSVETTSTTTNLHMPADDMIGRESEQELIIKRLLNGSEELQVISITGMQGIGKTTLATAVFRRPEIEYHFFFRAFVSVSQIYGRKKVFLRILEAIENVTEKMTTMSETELAEVVRKLLTRHRFLIVIDDVWETQAWNDISAAFPWGDQTGSRVLITTENITVATNAGKMGSSSIYELGFLSGEKSRELLRLRVFDKNQCPGELEDLEVEILNKCNGLPLSIIVVAGILLVNREQMRWWRSVAEGLIGKELSPMNDLIRISYDRLPQHLKPCFLYLGVFREDSKIPTRTILQLWIAEGLVQKHRAMCLEDVAAGYLQELVDRSLVMVEKRRSDGKVKTCIIHDALRLFCKKEARDRNFFREFTEFSSSSDDSARIIINSNNVKKFLASKPLGNHLRSLLIFGKGDFFVPLDYLSSIPKAFKLLRVLDVRSVRLTRFPAELCFLFLLRYIAIFSDLTSLPEKFSMLCNLQTLIVLTTQKILEIRADISKMSLLRHLYSKASITFPTIKEGLLANENLQTLSTISLESCGNENFLMSPNLRKLAIRGNMSTILDGNLFERLSGLVHLENLKLLNDDQSCKLKALPHQNQFPRNLTSLTLRGTLLDWKNMSLLGKLELLKVLKLKDHAFEGDIWETKDGGFQSLEVLHIGATNLLNWKASEEHFPKLVSLSLKHCNKLRDFPDAVADMPTLRTIDVYCCNSALAHSARRIAILKRELGDECFKLFVYPPDQ